MADILIQAPGTVNYYHENALILLVVVAFFVGGVCGYLACKQDAEKSRAKEAPK